jgi:reactive chlorine resistance protein C
MHFQPVSGDVPRRGTVFAFALSPKAGTASEASNTEQANMATGDYTHGAALAAQGERGHATAHERTPRSSQVEAVGRELARYGLVVVVGGIGLMKFTGYEAEGIRPFVANSPLLSWVYGPMSVRGFSALIGVIEVTVALLIALRPYSPRAAVLGSALAVGMFLTTLSFLVTTPGVWEPSLGGFPALSAVPGQFLLKDLALLGISLWTLGEAWKASEQRA